MLPTPHSHCAQGNEVYGADWKREDREKERETDRARETEMEMGVTYCIVENSQEVDLICQTVCLGLQFNLIHVGSVYILTKESTTCNWVISLAQQSLLCLPSNHALQWTRPAEKPIPVTRSAHLLQGHKFILCCCALVDFIFISTRGRVPHLLVSR